MAKLHYEAATSTVEVTEDVVLYSADDNDNAFIDPWGMIEKFEL